jgi:hypothetical protein
MYDVQLYIIHHTSTAAGALHYNDILFTSFASLKVLQKFYKSFVTEA